MPHAILSKKSQYNGSLGTGSWVCYCLWVAVCQGRGKIAGCLENRLNTWMGNKPKTVTRNVPYPFNILAFAYSTFPCSWIPKLSTGQKSARPEWTEAEPATQGEGLILKDLTPQKLCLLMLGEWQQTKEKKKGFWSLAELNERLKATLFTF